MTNSNILSKFQEQNSEIIRNNIKLNERIAFLEKVVSQLQQENLELRINQCQEKKKYVKPSKPRVRKPPKITNKTDVVTELLPPKRSSRSKVVDYAAPSLKAKLRKGDPHTFVL